MDDVATPTCYEPQDSNLPPGTRSWGEGGSTASPPPPPPAPL